MAATERGHLDRETERIYRLARAEIRDAARPVDLARAVLGPSAIVAAPASLLAGGGALVRFRGQVRIYVQRGLPPQFARFTVLHELAHYVLGPTASEDDCDALAARLLAPRPAFERALHEAWRPGIALAGVYELLGDWFCCTHSFAAMRLDEIAGGAMALVTPARVRIRGTDYPWPTESDLRALAKERRLPGLVKAQLRDDPNRVALRVARR